MGTMTSNRRRQQQQLQQEEGKTELSPAAVETEEEAWRVVLIALGLLIVPPITLLY
jgi:hypothetical protein